MIDAGRPIPGRPGVVFHVGVKCKKFAVEIEIDIVLIAEARRDDFPILAVGVGPTDPSAGGHSTPVA